VIKEKERRRARSHNDFKKRFASTSGLCVGALGFHLLSAARVAVRCRVSGDEDHRAMQANQCTMGAARVGRWRVRRATSQREWGAVSRRETQDESSEGRVGRGGMWASRHCEGPSACRKALFAIFWGVWVPAGTFGI
jgi:hypothetical protein